MAQVSKFCVTAGLAEKWQPTARFMTRVTCRLTAKNQDQLRNPTLSNRVWATFTFFGWGENYSKLHMSQIYQQLLLAPLQMLLKHEVKWQRWKKQQLRQMFTSFKNSFISRLIDKCDSKVTHHSLNARLYYLVIYCSTSVRISDWRHFFLHSFL